MNKSGKTTELVKIFYYRYSLTSVKVKVAVEIERIPETIELDLRFTLIISCRISVSMQFLIQC